MGRRSALRPRPRGARQDVHPLGGIPARRRRVRRRFLRHQPARGARDGPAAAVDAGDVVGGAGTGGHRPGRPAGFGDRRVHRDIRRRLRPAHGRRGSGPCRGLRHHGYVPERGLGPGGVRAGAGRPRGVGGHRVLLVAGRRPSGRTVPAIRRVRDGAGRRGDGHAESGVVRGSRPAAGPVGRRAVQVLRRGGRRNRLGRGRGRPGAGAVVGRPAQRAADLGTDPRLGRQPGRGVQRTHRAERTRPAARCPSGPGRRRAVARRRGRGGSTRHRHETG